MPPFQETINSTRSQLRKSWRVHRDAISVSFVHHFPWKGTVNVLQVVEQFCLASNLLSPGLHGLIFEGAALCGSSVWIHRVSTSGGCWSQLLPQSQTCWIQSPPPKNQISNETGLFTLYCLNIGIFSRVFPRFISETWLFFHMEVSWNRGTPKWMVIRENPNLKWMITRGTPMTMESPTCLFTHWGAHHDSRAAALPFCSACGPKKWPQGIGVWGRNGTWQNPGITMDYLGVSIVMYPKNAGWFISWKLPIYNGWWRPGYPHDFGTSTWIRTVYTNHKLRCIGIRLWEHIWIQRTSLLLEWWFGLGKLSGWTVFHDLSRFMIWMMLNDDLVPIS